MWRLGRHHCACANDRKSGNERQMSCGWAGRGRADWSDWRRQISRLLSPVRVYYLTSMIPSNQPPRVLSCQLAIMLHRLITSCIIQAKHREIPKWDPFLFKPPDTRFGCHFSRVSSFYQIIAVTLLNSEPQKWLIYELRFREITGNWRKLDDAARFCVSEKIATLWWKGSVCQTPCARAD